ncbi:hypothetical protein GALMADRAFT_564531 [Galerina marginata CBS 339.88]|uniref:Uncharacterized protein n=1 Tax=Galerina marginata (strain CBS 339.88) TaxID=685588 RepID=A0A067T4H6_GALM3|nr:hypothetical protein GALMADRAFT_564531 [Galerina marginata CBS 339.88]
MCFREVHCTRHACGHDHPQSDSRVDCGSATCRYSQSHNPSCSPKTCSYTCVQWLKPARNVVKATSPLQCNFCRRT